MASQNLPLVTLAETRASYNAMVAKYPQYEAEALVVRPVRALKKIGSKGRVIGFLPGDEALGVFEPYEDDFPKSEGYVPIAWRVYSARTGWHFGSSDALAFEFI